MLYTYPIYEYIISRSHTHPKSKKAIIHPGYINTLFEEYWIYTNLIKFICITQKSVTNVTPNYCHTKINTNIILINNR